MFIGLDISTTGSTALALKADGTVIVGPQVSHTLHTPQPGWAEQEPEDWWRAACAALRGLWQQVNQAEVQAVGLTGQMLGLVTLDAAGRSVRPAILWNDQRSAPQCAEITARVGPRVLHQRIGSMLLPGMTVPKLLWLREHEPANYARIARVLLPKDFCAHRLTGDLHTDVTDASGTGLLDIRRREWSAEMLAALELPREWLPRVFESQEVCGHVTEQAAAATGLPAGTPVVAGAGDQPAQALGNGIVHAGDSSITVGTSGVVFVAADRYAPDADGRWHTFCHAIPGQWCHMGVMLSAAGSLQWLRDTLFPDLSFAEMDALAATAPAGSAGLLFAPYLSGERHPHPDPAVRGGFVGLSLAHGRAHLIRAVMEGVAFGLRDLLELAREVGCHPVNARVSGGAAKSALWLQILADATGLPLTPMQVTHGGALGAAVLAAVGARAWPDVAAACAALVQTAPGIRPAGDAADTAAAYSRFRALYPALAPLTRHQP